MNKSNHQMTTATNLLVFTVGILAQIGTAVEAQLIFHNIVQNLFIAVGFLAAFLWLTALRALLTEALQLVTLLQLSS